MNRRRFIKITAFFFVCLVSTLAYGKDIKTLIKKAPKTHPRIFISAKTESALKKKIKSDPTLTKSLKYIIDVADGLEEVSPVERKMTGRRLLTISRYCIRRVTYLSFAYRMTGNKSYAERAKKEMLAVAKFSDWNPSHFLDVAEMTAALAIGYDWTYDALDADSRKKIKAAIVEKGLKTSLKGGWWVETENNWNQVCHGGLTLGALAVLEDEPELAAQIIQRAVENIPTAMHEYAPDGAYPEGPGYWNYGTMYNVIFLAAVEFIFGTDFGLSKEKGFMESADYYLLASGPTGLYFNYSDCGSGTGVSEAMYWFAMKRKDSSLLWSERRGLEDFLDDPPGAKSSKQRFFPLLPIWAENIDRASMPKIRNWRADGATPVAMHRSGWKDENEIYLGVKAGSPSMNHAHMDIGSFVMDADGVRWALDLGSQNYHSLESQGISLFNKKQNSQRWDVFRNNSFSHNTLVIEGEKQIVEGKAEIIRFSGKGIMPFTVVDMSPVYKGQLTKSKRGFGLYDKKQIIIQDEFKTLDRDTWVRWGMVTEADVKIINNTAILTQDGKQLTLQVISPTKVKLETFETARPQASFDAPNKGTRMIGFKVRFPPSKEARFAVVLQPGKGSVKKPTLKPLSDW